MMDTEMMGSVESLTLMPVSSLDKIPKSVSLRPPTFDGSHVECTLFLDGANDSGVSHDSTSRGSRMRVVAG
jgi:hypothetical protein